MEEIIQAYREFKGLPDYYIDPEHINPFEKWLIDQLAHDELKEAEPVPKI
jgi:hypothetical protein